MTVRIAVIGAGLMGADHAKIVAEDMPGAVLQVVCDMDAGRAAKVAAAHGAEVATDPEVVIARPDVDAVIVASPDFTHTPLSLACIRAGKRVLCEKPLSQSSAECLTVMQAESAFHWTAETPEDWERIPADWPDTRFAEKARRLGHDVWRLIYRRN